MWERERRFKLQNNKDIRFSIMTPWRTEKAGFSKKKKAKSKTTSPKKQLDREESQKKQKQNDKKKNKNKKKLQFSHVFV